MVFFYKADGYMIWEFILIEFDEISTSLHKDLYIEGR